MILLSMGLYLVASQCWKNRKLSNVGFAITSSSFSIYLIHQFIINLILLKKGIVFSTDWTINVVIIFIISFVGSILIDKLYMCIKQIIKI